MWRVGRVDEMDFIIPLISFVNLCQVHPILQTMWMYDVKMRVEQKSHGNQGKKTMHPFSTLLYR